MPKRKPADAEPVETPADAPEPATEPQPAPSEATAADAEARTAARYVKGGETMWFEQRDGVILGAVMLSGQPYVQARTGQHDRGEFPDAALSIDPDGSVVLQIAEHPGERQISKAKLHRLTHADLVALLKAHGHPTV